MFTTARGSLLPVMLNDEAKEKASSAGRARKRLKSLVDDDQEPKSNAPSRDQNGERRIGGPAEARRDALSKAMFGGRENHKMVLDGLTKAVSTRDGWRDVVIGARNKELEDLITLDDAVSISCDLAAMRMIIHSAWENKEGFSLSAIFENCIAATGGIAKMRSARTLRRRWGVFQQHGFKFPHPSSYVNEDGSINEDAEREPIVLDEFPRLRDAFDAYARCNLHYLSLDLMTQYANQHIVPALRIYVGVGERNLGTHNGNDAEPSGACDKTKRIDKKQAKPLERGEFSQTTVWRWLKRLGYEYDGKTKRYSIKKTEDEVKQNKRRKK